MFLLYHELEEKRNWICLLAVTSDNFISRKSFNEALIDLQNDRIDALLIDRVYANYYLETERILDQYEIFPAGFESESFAVGVRPADKTLLANLNKAFVELYQEGKFQEISKKWFGEDVATNQIKGKEN